MTVVCPKSACAVYTHINGTYAAKSYLWNHTRTQLHTAETYETGFCSSLAQQRMWKFRFNVEKTHPQKWVFKIGIMLTGTQIKQFESQLICYERNDDLSHKNFYIMTVLNFVQLKVAMLDCVIFIHCWPNPLAPYPDLRK